MANQRLFLLFVILGVGLQAADLAAQVCPLGTGYAYPGTTGVDGWACKPNQNQPWVHVFADVVATSNGHYLGAVQCNGLYPGTGWAGHPNHTSFSFPINSWNRIPNPGPHQIFAFVSNNSTWPGTGSANALTNVNATVTFPGIQGFVDAVDHVGVRGWAAYPDLPDVPLYVHIYQVSGGTESLLTTVIANDYRSDLTGLFGGNQGNIGFHWNWPTPRPAGSSITIRCRASYLPTPPGNAHMFGSDTTYAVWPAQGWLETTSAATIDGWAFNSSVGSCWVHFFYDGATSLGSGKYLGAVQANQYRPGIANFTGGNQNVAFSFPCTSWQRLPPAGTRTIQGYISSSSTWSGTAGTIPLQNYGAAGSASIPAIQGFVDSTDFSGVKGWACYPGSPNSPLFVHVVDSVAGSSSHLANIATGSLGPCGNTNNHGFFYQWPAAPALGSTRTVTLTASFGAAPLLTDQQIGLPINWAANPIGYFDGAHVGVFDGWAYLPGAGGSLWAHLYEDTGSGLSHLATATVGLVGRSDVQAAFGLPTGSVGFAAKTPRWYPTHENDPAYRIDGTKNLRCYVSRSSNAAAGGLFQLSGGPRSVDFSFPPPTTAGMPWGVVEALDADGASGWAFDPDTGDPITLDFYIQPNGVGPYQLFGSTLANQPRRLLGVPQQQQPSTGLWLGGFSIDWPNPPATGNYNIWIVARDATGTSPDLVLWDYFDASGNFTFPELTYIPSLPPNPADPTTNPAVSFLAVAAAGSDTRAMASIDIDGDGIRELVVGETVGRNVRVYLAGGATIPIPQSSEDVAVGWSLAAIDADGDGDEELLIGDPMWQNGRGRVRMWDFTPNGSGGFTTSMIHAVTAGTSASTGQWYGFSVESLGDLDGDGDDEWAVGAPKDDSRALTEAGFIRVYSGIPTSNQTILSTVAGDRFGWAIQRLGDVDGDGQPEFGVSAPDFIENLRTKPGRLQIYGWNGTTVVLDHPALTPMDGESGGFGFSFDGIGDINGDGYADIAVGAPFCGVLDREGSVHVLAGGPVPGSALIGNRITGNWKGVIGSSVTYGGDLNGDGVGDFVIGSMSADREVTADLDLIPIYGNPLGGGLYGPPLPGPVVTLTDFRGMSLASPADGGSGQMLLGGWNSSFQVSVFGRDLNSTTPIQSHPLPNGGGYVISFGTTAVPIAPGSVTATTTLEDRVTVTWAPLVGVTGYKVYRDGILFATVPGASNLSVTDVPPPGDFKYEVRAYNSVGDGAYSAEVTGRRLSRNVVPVGAHGGDSLYGLVSDDQGRLYVGNDRDDGVLVPMYRIDPAADYSGSIVDMVTTFGPAVRDGDAMCSDGSTILIDDQNLGIHAVPADGMPSSIWATGLLGGDPAHPMVRRQSDGHVFIGRNTGTGFWEKDANGAHLASNLGISCLIAFMALDEVDDALYYCDDGAIGSTTPIFRWDLATGSETVVCSVSGQVTWLEWDREGRRLLVARKGSSPQSAELLTVHPGSGQIATQLAAGELDEILGLEVDRQEGALYILNREPLDQRHHLYWMRLLPGTGEDLALGISINGGPPHAEVANEVLTVHANDVISTTVLSPGGSLNGEYFFVLGQFMADAALPQSPPTLLRSYVNEYGYILLDAGQLGPMPYQTTTVVPSYLAGRDYVFQIFCFSGLARNGVVALSEGRIMHFR